MKRNYKIELFVSLGDRLRQKLRDGEMERVIAESVASNPWFTPDNVRYAIEAICSDMLNRQTLEHWLRPYGERFAFAERRNVGVIMAGNIPLVGFSDLLSVLICGHRCLVKPSSKDRVLTEYVMALLWEIDPALPLGFKDGDQELEAVIATGSDATTVHFRAQYDRIPALLRGSRMSVAVLSGMESEAELFGLADDVFRYFGLGCRNVSCLFVPKGYDLEKLAGVLVRHKITHPKYVHGYRQALAVSRLCGQKFVDGGFFMLKEGDGQGSSLSEIRYTCYSDVREVTQWLADNDSTVQCVVSGCLQHPRRVDFGQAQHPAPADYPDGVDVIEFLHRISTPERVR